MNMADSLPPGQESQAQLTTSQDATENLTVLKSLPPDLLIIVFIHGFKGTESTFGGFPDRLQHILSETISNVVVECIVFPAYETKGELTAAVERFVDWLTHLTVDREVAKGSGGGAGKARIVLCGHSMGGLLAADTLIGIAESNFDVDGPLWPRIVACIAFDTPYLGLHPFIFKNSATQAIQYAQTAHTVATDVLTGLGIWGSQSSAGAASTPASVKQPVGLVMPAAPEQQRPRSLWEKWAPAAYAFGGTVVAGAAAGAAYYKRKDIGEGYAWATDHMKYVGNLWDEKALNERLRKLVEIGRKYGVLFRTYHTYLPPDPPRYPLPRTFMILPKTNSDFYPYFLPTQNGLAKDEIQAHTGMFEAATNDGYYQLGLETVRMIREAVMLSRGVVEDEQAHTESDLQAKEADEERSEEGGPSDVGDA